MSEYEWTDEMGELSGMGGDYEQACRDMVIGGVEWLDENPDVEPKFTEIPSAFGSLEPETDDAKSLVDAMLDAVDDGAPTGAMVHQSARQVMFVHKRSWEEYVEVRIDGGD